MILDPFLWKKKKRKQKEKNDVIKIGPDLRPPLFFFWKEKKKMW